MKPPACKHSWEHGVMGSFERWTCLECGSVRHQPPPKRPGSRMLVVVGNTATELQEPRHGSLIAGKGQHTTPSLTDAAEATLLFHSASPWTEEKRRRWQMITGTEEATTRNLCDTCRKALQQEGGGR